MRALLIDDERLARTEMRRLLAAHPEVEIVGEAGNAQEAHAQIHALRPDLLFLDVELPGATGFDLLELSGLATFPAIIFTTAFENYALRAFEVHATDYLLKPIRPERLREALKRALAEQPSAPRTPLEHFFVRSGERGWMVRVADIRLIESEGNYSRLHFAKEQPLILRSLGALQARLDNQFFRANRSQILNLRFVKTLDLEPDGSLRATLKDSTEVILSRRQSQLLKERMTL